MAVARMVSPAEHCPTSDDGPPNVDGRANWFAPLVIMLAVLLVRLPFLASSGFTFDTAQFVWWGWCAQQHGLGAVYEDRTEQGHTYRRCNIPPLHIVSFSALMRVHALLSGESTSDYEVVRTVLEQPDSRSARLATLLFKLPATLADLVTALLVWRWLHAAGARRLAITLGIAFAINPAIWYDSAVWGQVDSVHALLMVLSLRAAVRGRVTAMWAWATLAILTKAQSIVLAPVWVLVWWNAIRNSPVQRRWSAVGYPILVMAAITLPMLAALGSNWRAALDEAYRRASGYYPRLHLNGFSMWYLADSIDAPSLGNVAVYQRDDVEWVAGLTARQVGFAALAITTLLLLVALARLRAITQPPDPSYAATAANEQRRRANFATSATLCLAFFVLSTQMHERYVLPAVILWAFCAEANWRWWAGWCVLSIGAFVNMLWAWCSAEHDLLRQVRSWLFWTPGCGETIGRTCAVCFLGLLGWLVWMRWRPPRDPSPSPIVPPDGVIVKRPSEQGV